ncbi:MAG: hypothetical protein BLM47_08645 [Candidatus Reconcilbacillus cellulovorans]|uniref:Uncharacterized protein n=1 Tax=Candidatus Reconcilbacillus cellulovorans TaxID=1906605 RepID=A0A2A6DZK4_9BACL|nr:MAG: hypothetical protein BLM47_08645 [Candidatus Reconcilbacillus cellulovorans]
MPKEYQDILVEESRIAGLEVSKQMEQEAEQIKQELKSKGVTIVSDVDLDAFRKAGEEAYKKLNLVEARNQVYKDIGKSQ